MKILNCNKKRITLLLTLFILTIILASVFNFEKANAADYMKLDYNERIDLAKKEYKCFSRNLDEYTEVLISFTDNIKLKDIDDIISNKFVTISLFHYFVSSKQIITGGYIDCKNKTLNCIQDDYYKDLLFLINDKIETLSNEIRKIEKGHLEELEKERCEDQQPLTNKIKMYNENIEMLLLQKEEIINNNISVSGIRLYAKNEDIVVLLNDDSVRLIEVLNFDNPDIVTPLLPY